MLSSSDSNKSNIVSSKYWSTTTREIVACFIMLKIALFASYSSPAAKNNWSLVSSVTGETQVHFLLKGTSGLFFVLQMFRNHYSPHSPLMTLATRHLNSYAFCLKLAIHRNRLQVFAMPVPKIYCSIAEPQITLITPYETYPW
jgi:hypothetical protein